MAELPALLLFFSITGIVVSLLMATVFMFSNFYKPAFRVFYKFMMLTFVAYALSALAAIFMLNLIEVTLHLISAISILCATYYHLHPLKTSQAGGHRA